MATKRVTLSMVNFNSDLCGFRFENSVATVEDDGTLRMQRLFHRLTTLFPGSVIEEISPACACVPTPAPTPAPGSTPAPAMFPPAPTPAMFMDEADTGALYAPVEPKSKGKGKRK